MNTKKIGIINFQYSDHNYGAVLQAAALEHIIENLGYSAEHINYIPYNKKSILYKIKSGFIGYLIKLLLRKNKPSKYIKNKNVFECFRKKWITRTKETYLNNTDLDKLRSSYSAIIVGSDQVWRPKMYSHLNEYYVYFLEFADTTTLKISYAASFGVDNWEIKDENYTKKIKNSISKFSAISTREDSGIDICSSVFSSISQHVLDPTLLIDKEFFNKIIVDLPSISERSIVYYKLDITKKFTKSISDLGKMINCQVENIYHNEKLLFNYYLPVPTWINKIKNSTLVITDSFHCVCFCIIFSKNFFCIKNKDRGESRLFSLLSMLGLEDRFIHDDELVNKVKQSSDINYINVNRILNNNKKISEKFISDALSLTS